MMKTKRLVSIATAFIFTATLMFANFTSVSLLANNCTISDQGISSEVVLAQELLHQ